MGNTAKGNYIGTDVQGIRDLGNSARGCSLWLDAKYNTVGPGNVLAYNDLGVKVLGSDTFGNTITQNGIFSNQWDAIRLEDGANRNIPGPVIASVLLGPVRISGTSCPYCTVEVFANQTWHQQAETYVGSDVADAGGEWAVTVAHLSKPFLTASATHVLSGTSEISGPWDSGIRTVFLPLVARSP
jgi:hypothetical protein